MNRKFYAGMIAFGVATGFWACGDGEIVKVDPNSDSVMAYTDPSDPTYGIDVGAFRTYCPECVVAKSSSSSATTPRPPRSSSSQNYSRLSSSSQVIIINTSSSADAPVVSSSSNSGPVFIYSSSSSAPTVVPGNDAGKCMPAKASYERGDNVNWTFERGAGLDPATMLKSKFVWTTADASVPTATETGMNGRTHVVSYATSGKHSATLQITTATGVVHNLTCEPVQINGAPITGCKCAAEEKNPDVSVGAVWNVTGCSSVGADIVSYTWAGAVADPTTSTKATQAFAAKNQAAAPIVTVANNDNTEQQVQCDTVVSVDATDPDYILTEQNTKIELPKGESTLVLDLPSGWHGGTNTGTCTLRCDDAGGPVTITVGTQSSKADYSATLSIPVENTMNKSAIVVGLDLAAKCQIAY
ncbi:hypothetical protein [Fibrobacter sp. UBA4297]|uniref:hypothetical protein n=1 Tax=Fibrobacter sp. UBA4297 TaxID=1946536 RepID=UPI0025C32749|nr:hypothetical protein [Fibrobacter sp. UBA4297]